ncbi:unnamed protein product [Cuscuta campestris]|uniref:non-specific serine/threonine protein kinase n=1 Tax=Cuscuta campestris TaxID=132261 RepID=A0A484LA42_9ASTE|nr:unnamed protein product [Cuscuta campestris]
MPSVRERDESRMPSRQPLSATVPSYPRLIKFTAIFIAITALSSLITLFAIAYFLYYLWYSVLRRSPTSPLFDSNNDPLVKLRRFSYRELSSATHGFSPRNAIGKGGSGTVFRGSLKDGKSVAVKLLDSSSLESERDFQNELLILGGIKSELVVSLVGYCVEKRKRLVVYEYMPNRSLQELLFSETNSGLDWGRRFGIVLDVAKALSFLHLECDPPVVHGDVKPSNVLLDLEFKAKLSDFGLSRLKTDFVGADLFSQEIGGTRSPQDLSGNLGTPTPQEESRDDEVDFAMALQASSSSNPNSFKNSQNFRAPGLNSMNYNAVFDADDKITTRKGKSVEKDWNNDDDGDGDDDEVSSSIGQGKELDLSNNAVSGESIIDHSMLQGRDWWWRQDVSGELCTKDYVMEWIGTQIFHSANPNWDEEGKENVGCVEEVNQTGIPGGKELLELQNKKPRVMKEWWKEEHLDELSRKKNKKKKSANGNNPNKTKCIRSIRFKVRHFDLGKHFAFMAQNSERRCDLERELSFRRGWKKKKKKKKESHCVGGGSDAWSGEIFSRDLSSTTSMRGTLCYVAPEYGRSGYLMEKGDIYSLGVLILVIVSGRRPLHVLNSPMKLERANLVSWCKHLAHSGNVLEVVDEKLGDEYNKDEARLCVSLALACLQRVPELRPDIGDIVKILSGEMCLSSLRFDFLPSPPSKLLHRSMRREKRNAELGFRM